MLGFYPRTCVYDGVRVLGTSEARNELGKREIEYKRIWRTYRNRSCNAPLLTPWVSHDARAIVHISTTINGEDNASEWRRTATTGNEHRWRGNVDDEHSPARTRLIRTFPMLKCPTFSSSTLVSLSQSTVAMIRPFLSRSFKSSLAHDSERWRSTLPPYLDACIERAGTCEWNRRLSNRSCSHVWRLLIQGLIY